MATEPTTGPITAINGTVSFDSVISDIRNFNVDRVNEVKTYVSSSTAGFTKTAKGNFLATDSFEMFLDQGAFDVGFTEGDLGDLILTSASGKTFTSEARIGNIAVGVDIEGNNFEGATVSFTANGTWAVV